MYASISPVAFAFAPSSPAAISGTDSWSRDHYQPRDPIALITLIRNHHQAIFHLTHALLRDEVAAEKITQQVFSRARRRLERSKGSSVVVEWIYYACFRFVRTYHHKSAGPIARRRNGTPACSLPGLDLHTLVRVIVRHPGKLDPRDCELLALRQVLGMSFVNIAQLLRLHPYEVSNRLAWAHERVCKLCEQPTADPHPSTEEEKSKTLALSA
ncbi:MAG: polymerase subunit sigma-24 [Rariglobus sp.]|jgi:DNA-directed RNA polymerase specialized sigma24 family protein|nr:polymerase subunit sigma-24 [Rariglobus sp.]